jgi:hypothetical protein
MSSERIIGFWLGILFSVGISMTFGGLEFKKCESIHGVNQCVLGVFERGVAESH